MEAAETSVEMVTEVVNRKRENLSFTCYLCGMHEFYTHYGKGSRARDSKLEYKEDVFMLNNPFLPADTKPENCLVPFLVLGGTCNECEKTVCVDASCSIFCHKRYCLSCVKLHEDKFPEAVVKECLKREATKDPPQ
ncbi:hypothetical protein RvY_07058-3 [Ramazzottius varieornatus]|uniref:Cysteine-rich DPF motif domain-containing protein 1 n=1 Tax=Ramazzottius varieornatus TaxID=947166 RepID=A0A1D1V5X4_RAMVA|nr:hypothetical protein RvY_07058-3 [Ramazzottius varieornatus]